jgi:hypothetical protein
MDVIIGRARKIGSEWVPVQNGFLECGVVYSTAIKVEEKWD